MHPSRLNMLAHRHAPERAIVSRQGGVDGTAWIFYLECGHTARMVSHFDGSKAVTRRCDECGAEHVKTAPQYAGEFAAEREAMPPLWEAS